MNRSEPQFTPAAHEAILLRRCVFKPYAANAGPMFTLSMWDTGRLILRPGDTDADYFADYTDGQRAFCAAHAEALACEVYSRFEAQ
jgi:hypothetical protein